MKFGILGTRGYPSTYGGFETMVRHLAPHLTRRGHDVVVYDRGAPGERVVDGIRVVGTRGADSKSASTLSYGFTSHLHASRQNLDAALVCNVANGCYLPLLRRRGTPTAVNVDGIEWERDKWGRAAKAAFQVGARATARFADRLISDSRAIADRWQVEFGRTSAFIPYGAPLLDVSDAERVEAVGLTPGSYALIVARLVPENNIDIVLRAFRARSDRPLVIVGSSNYRSELSEQVSDLAARHRTVRAFGHVADQRLLNALWANCRMYIHGHSVGGTNPALLQAMGAGAAILAFGSVYNREVLGDDGVFWRDAPSLAAVWAELWDDDTRRTEVGKAARARAAATYRWDDVVAQYERVLVELARTQGTR